VPVFNQRIVLVFVDANLVIENIVPAFRKERVDRPAELREFVAQLFPGRSVFAQRGL